MPEASVSLASLSGIAAAIASVASWFWGIFTDLIGVIASNDLILWPVVLAIVAGVILMGVKVIRKFGIKGRG